MSHPKSWKTDPQDLDVIRPFSAGTLESQLKVPAAGRYGLWLGGSFKSGLQVSIDGKRAGAGRNQLSHPGPLTPLGEAELSRGPHRISIHYDGADLHPGSGGPPYRMGPLVLGQTTADRPVTYVRPSGARSLCGKTLDWVEAIGGPRRVPDTAGTLSPLTRSSQALFGRELQRKR